MRPNRIKPMWTLPTWSGVEEPPSPDLRALGWLEPSRFAEVAREVVVRDILDPLATIGIEITKEEREQLFERVGPVRNLSDKTR